MSQKYTKIQTLCGGYKKIMIRVGKDDNGITFGDVW